MYKQKSLLAFVFTMLSLPSFAVTAQTQTVSRTFNQAGDNAVTAAKKELSGAARAFRVSLDLDRTVYATDGTTTIAQAPIAHNERYLRTDFAAGAPILVMIVKSATKLAVPDGAYLIKAQYQPKDTSGKAIFVDRNGGVSTEQELLVRSWEQSSTLFPGAYENPMPQEIPNITSTHIIIIKNGVKKWYVDCSGENGTLYFEMG